MATLPSTTLFSRLAVIATALFCLAPFSALAADVQPAGQLAFTVDVPANKLTVKQVHDVVLGASIGRAWIVKEDAPDRVVVYLNHRKNEATVTYLITDTKVSAYCEGWKTNGKGVRKQPELRAEWSKPGRIFLVVQKRKIDQVKREPSSASVFVDPQFQYNVVLDRPYYMLVSNR